MRAERDGGGVLTLTLGRPRKLNAMDAAEWRELRANLCEAGEDRNLRVVVLRAEGRAFCAGNDLPTMAACRTPEQARAYFFDTMLPAFEAMATSPLPIVAGVGAPALGGGVELIQFCDLAVAARDVTFALPEVRAGVWPTVFLGAAPWIGQRRLGQRMAFTAEPLTASEALAAGLITHVADDLDRVLDEVIHSVITGDRDAVAHSKRFANRALVEHGLPAVREALTTLIEQTMGTPAYERGVAGFARRHA